MTELQVVMSRFVKPKIWWWTLARFTLCRAASSGLTIFAMQKRPPTLVSRFLLLFPNIFVVTFILASHACESENGTHFFTGITRSRFVDDCAGYAKGALSGDCERTAHLITANFPRDHLADVFDSFDGEYRASPYSIVDEPGTTLWVTRERGEHAKLFHAHTDFLNMFHSMEMLEVDPSQTSVLCVCFTRCSWVGGGFGEGRGVIFFVAVSVGLSV
jgi:hypothetical protein